MAVVGAAANVAALTTFDHRHDRLDLGALAIGIAIEMDLHLSAVVTGSGLRRGATMLRWNDRTNSVLVAGKRMIAFRIVTGIGKHCGDPNPGQRLAAKSTVHDYLMLWDWDGTLARVHHALYLMVRELEGREASPSAGVIDSQSVKSAEKGGRTSTLRAMMRARKSRARSAICSSIPSA